MSNTTAIYWEARGVSLSTHAWNVRTFGGNRYATPPKRGENYQLPYMIGRRWQRKRYDERSLDLSMWMLPINPDGTRDDSMSVEAKQHDNWQFLMTLLDVPGLFPLKKRWYQNGEVVSATAMVELADVPDPTVEGGHRLVFTVPLTLPDPFFYGDPVTEPVATIEVQGNMPTNHVTISMPAGRVTMTDGNWIEYTGPGTVVINCLVGTARQGSLYVNGLIDRNPEFAEWPTLYPGTNNLSGSGSVTYEPAYF